MSIKATYKDDIFEPLEEVTGVRPGQHCTVFLTRSLARSARPLGWLKAAAKSFEFWNNPADAIYDTL